MYLLLRNFAKISNAKIKIDGITVIGGKNNSGKTTIGKTLFAYYNSFYKIDKKINNLKRDELRKRLEASIYESIIYGKKETKNRNKNMFLIQNLSRELTERILDYFNDINKIEIDSTLVGVVNDVCSLYDDSLTDVIIDICKGAFEDFKRLPDDLIVRSIVEDNFKRVFDNQICNFNSKGQTEVVVEIKGTTSKITFDNNRLKTMDQTMRIEHDAIFIDNPSSVISSINRGIIRRTSYDYYTNVLVDKLIRARHNYVTSIKSINAKEKKEIILKYINDVANGDFVFQNNSLMFKEKNNKVPTSLCNISMGLKSIVLIKQLIESDMINDNDFLILDEPEVHLHPEWQIKYAEIIVLLQKVYNLNIVVTTHSRDFFEAIELYSKKHNSYDKCNFYLACEEAGKTEIKDLESDPIELYRQLIKSNEILDKLRFELEDKNDIL